MTLSLTLVSEMYILHNVIGCIFSYFQTEYEFTTLLKHTDYVGNLEPENCMSFQAYAMVEKTRRRPMESCVKEHDIEFGEPELKVKVSYLSLKPKPDD